MGSLCWAEGTTTICHIVNFLIQAMVLCSLRMVQLWKLIRLGSMPKGIAIYEENSSCHNHKDTKRNKQHFWFLYNKTFFFFFFFFKAIVFISLQKKLQKCVEYKKGYMRFTCLVGRDRERKGEISLNYSDDIRETTTDFCYGHIDLVVCFLGFVDKIIWIHKDSISISWFWSDQQDSTSRFRCVQCLSDCLNVCLTSGLLSSLLPTAYMEWGWV